MESGPPLNLTTTVKVEEMKIGPLEEQQGDFTVEGEVVEEIDQETNENAEFQCDEGTPEFNASNKDGAPLLAPEPEASKTSSYVGDKNYQCSECQMCFARASQLRSHERSHFDEQTYECDQCDKVFSRIGLLMSHRQEHHKQMFSCTECDAKFSHYHTYRLHLRRHKCERPFKCTDCNMAFAQMCHLQIHNRIHTGEKPFECEVCHQKFKQVSHLTTHMRIHTKDKPYKCNICSASFSQTSSLTRHKRRHSGEKPFKCEECQAPFVERRNLTRHMLIHTGEKPYHCDLCDARFAQMIDCKRHKMSHQGLKPYKCTVCDAAFSRKNNLRWHKLTHEGDTPFRCEKCNAGFSLMRDLKTHLRMHTTYKPYNCDQCQAQFSHQSTLKRHKIIHNDERQFSCSQCKSSFKEKSALKRHMLRHEGVKPFACSKCDSTFIEFRNLKRHKVVVHGEERFEGADVVLDNVEVENQPEFINVKTKTENTNEKEKPQVHDASYQTPPLDPSKQEPLQPDPNIEQVNSTLAFSDPINQPSQPDSIANIPPQQLAEMITIPSHTPGQMPTLLLTQPGQPPKPARPANDCLNHQSHVLTFMEGNYNQWQAWCFCDTPNIPSSSQTSIEGSEVMVNNSATITESVASMPAPQTQTAYSEIVASHSHQTVGVEDVNQPEYQVSQYNSSYTEPLLHYEEAKPLQQLPQHSRNKMSSLQDEKIFPTSNQEHIEHKHQIQQADVAPSQHHYDTQNQHVQQQHLEAQQQQTHQQTQLQHQSVQHHTHSTLSRQPEHNHHYLQHPEQQLIPEHQEQPPQSQQQPQYHQQQLSQAQHHQLPPQPHQQQLQPQYQRPLSVVTTIDSSYTSSPPPMQDQMDLSSTPTPQSLSHLKIEPNSQGPEQPIDPKLTLQYSFTVSNPATGDIQIQSEAFPANPSEKVVKPPPSKKKRAPKDKATNKNSQQENRVYHCIECLKTFSRENHLLIHQRTHTGEKPFQCGVCNQCFTHKNSLTIHMRGHTGERPYSCTTCGTTFTQKSNLRVHMRTHTGEKPFKCKLCSVSFTQGSHLTAHLRIHNNDRPFSCEVCQQSFTQRSALKRHSMTHTGQKPHKCDQCTARFSQKDDLRRHQKIHNANQGKDSSTGGAKRQKSADADTSKAKRQKCSDEKNSSKVEYPCPQPECKSTFSAKCSLARHMTCVHESTEEKSSQEESTNFTKPEVPDSPKKLSKSKPKENVSPPIEPVRTSKRIRENAEKKKYKQENSDFIIGDFVHIVEEEERRHLNRQKLKKEKMMTETKIEAKEKMEFWCFCEVPHGPDEPHTLVESNEPHTLVESNEPQTRLEQPPPDLPAGETPHQLASCSADVSGASSLLQLSMENIHHNTSSGASSSTSIMTESFPPAVMLDSPPTIVPAPQVVDSTVRLSGPSNPHNQAITTVGHTDAVSSLVPADDSLNPPVENPAGLSNQDVRIVGQQMLSAPLLSTSGQLVNANQLVGADGTIYIEAGEMLSNGTVVINSGSGTIISYEQISINSDGQVVTVPVPSSGAETLMLQPAPVSTETQVPGENVTYSTATQVSEANTSQPVQYTAIGGDVLSLFSQVEQGTETTPSEKHPTIVAKPLDCSVCAKSFASKSSLWKHMKGSHPDLFCCSECCAAFTTKEYLEQHKAQQHQKLHICSRCGMAFTSKKYLARHRSQMHSNKNSSSASEKERIFVCETCSTKFYQQSDLKRHMLSHTGEKPFKCSNCDAGFTRMSSLNKHVRIHTGEKPYVCSVCNQAFAYRYQFNRHKLVHKDTEDVQINTGDKQFVCNVCHQTFANRYQLNRHKSIHKELVQKTVEPQKPDDYSSMPYVIAE